MKALESAIKTELFMLLSDLTASTSQSIEKYATEIAADAVLAIAQGKTDLTDELLRQIQAVSYVHRVYISRQSSVAVQRILGAIIRTVATVIA